MEGEVKECQNCNWWTKWLYDKEWGICRLADYPGAPIAADEDADVNTKEHFGCIKYNMSVMELAN